MTVSMQDVMKQSGVAFGTSGARGLVTAMTDRVCYVYARSFIKYCEQSYKCEHTIAIAGDLRPSTERKGIQRIYRTVLADSVFYLRIVNDVRNQCPIHHGKNTEAKP